MRATTRYLTLSALAVTLAASPALADTYKLISGAVICKSDEGLERWLEAVEKLNEPTKSKLLTSGECVYNFRAQLVETVGLRMFFKTVKVRIDGVEWITQKSNLRVPAPKPGEEEK